MNYRQRPDPPREFEELRIRRHQQQEIDHWLKTPIDERGKKPFLPPKQEQLSPLMTLLYQMFYGKCAYCETPLLTKEARLAFFRPLENAYQQGQINAEPDHYFWLLWDWSNLYLACRTCRDTKGTKFPIRSEKRADLGTLGAYRLKLLEKPLLLDPCLDNPAMHLEFRDDGTLFAKSERGKETIAVLDLNRDELRTARKVNAQELQTILNKGCNTITFEELNKFCQNDQPFVGMRRQLLRRWLQIKSSSPDTPLEIKTAFNETPWKEFIEQLESWHQQPALTLDLFEAYVQILLAPDVNRSTGRTQRRIDLINANKTASTLQLELEALCYETGLDSAKLARGTIPAFINSIVGEAQARSFLPDIVDWLDSRTFSIPPIRNRWALLVGINRYVDPSFPKLRYCINDVLALKNLLERLGYTVVILHNEIVQEHLTPTRNNIKAELAKLCQAMDQNDLLYVHFACHGTQEKGQPLLITSDARVPMLEQTGLPVAELEREMRNSKAKRLILTLDACHVGIEIGRARTDYELFIRNVYELAEGFALIAGSTAQQLAYEWGEKQHGVFTYYLIEGLGGKAANSDKLVTINGLKNFALDRLRRWNIEHGGILQEPTARVEGIGDMILSDYRNSIYLSENGSEAKIVREVLQE